MAVGKRRWLRWLGGGFLSLLALLGLGLVVTLAPVDPGATPRAALPPDQLTQDPAALRAGWARAKLTPVLSAAQDDPIQGHFRQVPLAGYGQRAGAPATGVHDDVWVKAFAFASRGSTGVMVSADALIIPREISELAAMDLAATTGLKREQIYFSATHTHCSLGGWGQRFVGEAFAGPYNPAVQLWFAQQLATAARGALADLQPAELGQGSFAAPELVRNRLVGDRGEVDPEFTVLLIRQADGDRAVIGSYSAHATVLGADVREFSGDYPGVWQRAVEASGIQQAAFFAGGVGSHSPRAPQGGFEGTKAMGEALASRTAALLPQIPLSPSVDFAASLAVISLPDLQVRLTDSIRLRPWVARNLMPPLSETTLLQAFRFGNRVWLSTPCDYSGELALQLKAKAREAGIQAVVTSFNGDYVGYVIPSKYYHLDGYEPRVMNFYGARISEVFADTLAKLAVPSKSR